MSTVSDAILTSQAYQSGNTPTMDLSKGGQFGYSADYENYISTQHYMRQPLVLLLLEAPKVFSLMPDPQRWVSALKAMVETHPKSVTGFNAGLEVAISESPLGGSGEMLEEVTDTTRVRSTPSFVYNADKYGQPIQSLIYNWITIGLKDPDTKRALINTLEGDLPDALLLHHYSMSVLAYEPDPTGRFVHRAWIMRNMFPKGTGDIIGSNDKTAPTDLEELTIEFTGFQQVNLGATLFAQKLLDRTSTVRANPYLQPAFIDDIDPDVKAIDDTVGYNAGINNLVNNAVSATR